MNGGASSDLHALRKESLRRFSERGFPTTREEEWRFTNVAPIAKTQFKRAGETSAVSMKDVERFILPGKGLRLVFINGHFSAPLSLIKDLPRGVRATSLAHTLANAPGDVRKYISDGERKRPFGDLNTAFLWDGAFVEVHDNASLDHPILILHVSSDLGYPHVVHPRNIIVLGKNSRASIVEYYAHLSPSVYLTNAVSDIVVGDGSVLEYDKVQHESEHAFHIGTVEMRLQSKSSCVSNSISMGGAIVRNTVVATLGAEGSECTLNGLSFGTGKQLVDNHTTIDHARPHCSSHELYKAIHDGSSRGVFNGKIIVRKDAQKTDAKQTNRTLLLSDLATIDTKPQLEIFADDVKCTHGATVGQLDEEQVFYLRSRGIDEPAARDILTRAFAEDVIKRMNVVPLREQLRALLNARLRQGRLVEGEN